MTFDEILVGTTATFQKVLTDEDSTAFADLSGDQNPLHTDDQYAKKSGFRGRVVHGMLLGALVSRLIGMNLPGQNALLVKEILEFRAPAYSGEQLTVTGTVTNKTEAAKLIEIEIEIRSETTRVASGTVIVLVRTEV